MTLRSFPRGGGEREKQISFWMHFSGRVAFFSALPPSTSRSGIGVAPLPFHYFDGNAPHRAGARRSRPGPKSWYIGGSMKLHQSWVSWASLGCVCLFVACGGSSESAGDGGGSGTAGAGGSSVGGSSAGKTGGGSGGKASGGSSSGGVAGKAGAPQGGSRNMGGGAGTGGFNLGGAGLDPADFACESPPKVGAECDADANLPCVNGLSICFCNMSKWECQNALGGGKIGDLECPDTKPTTGAACGDEVGFCPYGGQFTGCACYQGSWACL